MTTESELVQTLVTTDELRRLREESDHAASGIGQTCIGCGKEIRSDQRDMFRSRGWSHYGCGALEPKYGTAATPTREERAKRLRHRWMRDGHIYVLWENLDQEEHAAWLRVEAEAERMHGTQLTSALNSLLRETAKERDAAVAAQRLAEAKMDAFRTEATQANKRADEAAKGELGSFRDVTLWGIRAHEWHKVQELLESVWHGCDMLRAVERLIDIRKAYQSRPAPAVSEAMRAVVANLRSLVDHEDDDVVCVYAESALAAAEDELSALDAGTHVLVEKGRLEMLTGEKHTFKCIYCGHLHVSTIDDIDAAMREHQKVCPKDPMRALESTVAALTKELERVREQRNDFGAELTRIRDVRIVESPEAGELATLRAEVERLKALPPRVTAATLCEACEECDVQLASNDYEALAAALNARISSEPVFQSPSRAEFVERYKRELTEAWLADTSSWDWAAFASEFAWKYACQTPVSDIDDLARNFADACLAYFNCEAIGDRESITNIARRFLAIRCQTPGSVEIVGGCACGVTSVHLDSIDSGMTVKCAAGHEIVFDVASPEDRARMFCQTPERVDVEKLAGEIQRMAWGAGYIDDGSLQSDSTFRWQVTGTIRSHLRAQEHEHAATSSETRQRQSAEPTDGDGGDTTRASDIVKREHEMARSSPRGVPSPSAAKAPDSEKTQERALADDGGGNASRLEQGERAPESAPPPAGPREGARALIEKARQEVYEICGHKHGWRMSIPVDKARDSDIIICDALEAADKIIAEFDAPSPTAAQAGTEEACKKDGWIWKAARACFDYALQEGDRRGFADRVFREIIAEHVPAPLAAGAAWTEERHESQASAEHETLIGIARELEDAYTRANRKVYSALQTATERDRKNWIEVAKFARTLFAPTAEVTALPGGPFSPADDVRLAVVSFFGGGHNVGKLIGVRWDRPHSCDVVLTYESARAAQCASAWAFSARDIALRPASPAARAPSVQEIITALDMAAGTVGSEGVRTHQARAVLALFQGKAQ